jgi:SAM-dependent methyltransferase
MTEFTPEELETIATYDATAADWASKHNTTSFWAEELKVFQRYLPAGKILEIGCGGARDAKLLLAAGYDYTGTDVSVGLVKEAQKNLPQATFLQQSLYDLDFSPQSFDGFWAAAVLLHIPKKRLGEALNRLNMVLKPGAVGYISVKQGEGEGFDDQVGKRFFAYYRQAEMTEALGSAGFEVMCASARKIHEKLTWLNFWVKKSG